MWIYGYLNTSVIRKTRSCVEGRRLLGGVFFTYYRVFPISTSVYITASIYGKNNLYFIYNITQKNTRLFNRRATGNFPC